VELKIFKGQQLLENGLAEQIVALDRKNMQTTLDEAGNEFPEDKRRKGLESDSTFIIAFDEAKIIGYLDYLPSWNNPEYIYIGSVQVEKRYRGTGLLLMLLDRFRTLVAAQDFAGFETNVQKANRPAVKLYQKLGFTLEENPRNAASWTARAGKELLTGSPVIALIERWRKRR
jgi:ribosomal protein S18 acetylase RimI-like enzyme